MAIVKGTKAKEVTSILKKIPEVVRLQVEEVTLDFSDSMHQIVSACFPKAMITLDRFHHQQFCMEALPEIRIGHRREVMPEVANARVLPKTINGCETIFKKRQIKAAKNKDGFIFIQYV